MWSQTAHTIFNRGATRGAAGFFGLLALGAFTALAAPGAAGWGFRGAGGAGGAFPAGVGTLPVGFFAASTAFGAAGTGFASGFSGFTGGRRAGVLLPFAAVRTAGFAGPFRALLGSFRAIWSLILAGGGPGIADSRAPPPSVARGPRGPLRFRSWRFILRLMSVKKKILIGIPLLLILLVVVLYLFIDRIAKKAVEVGGTQAMGVPTSLESITLKPLQGAGSIEGLKISNPAGFETPFFMNLSKGDAAIELGSVLEDTIVLERIELDGLKAHLEKTKAGANYEVILENMKKGEEPKKEPGKKFLVKRVVVRDIAVRADIAVAGEKLSSVDLHIDEIALENVGSESGAGTVTSQLTGTIVKAVLTAIVEQGARVLPEVMVNGLGAGLKGLGKVGFKVVGNVTAKVGGKAVEVIGGAGKAVGGAVKDVGGAIGGIFGGKKDDDK